MKVLVTGARGQLGSDLMAELERRKIEAIGVDVAEMDITDANACDRVIKEERLMRSFTAQHILQWIGQRMNQSLCERSMP